MQANSYKIPRYLDISSITPLCVILPFFCKPGLLRERWPIGANVLFFVLLLVASIAGAGRNCRIATDQQLFTR
jgi:hypothetical protein